MQTGSTALTLLPAIFLYIMSACWIPMVAIVIINAMNEPIDPATLPPPGAERDGYMMGYWVSQIGIGVVPIVCSLLIMLGAFHLHTHRSRGMAMTGAILACIPLLTPCLLLGIPLGIWALVVLNMDEVRARFAATRASRGLAKR